LPPRDNGLYASEVRVLIVDDHVLYRQAVRELLEKRGHVVVAEAETGREALAASRRFRPDVVLLDVRLEAESGYDVAQALTSDRPELAVVLMSVDSDDSPDLVRACGARARVSKTELPTLDLAEVLSGGVAHSP